MATITTARVYHRTAPPRYCADVQCSNGNWYTDRCFEHQTTSYPDAPFSGARALELCQERVVYWNNKAGDSCPWDPQPPPPTPPPPTPPSGEHTLTVVVVPGNNRVELYDSTGYLVSVTATSSNGRAVFTNLLTDTYTVKIYTEGYHDISRTVTVRGDTSLPINLVEITPFDWIILFVINAIETIIGFTYGAISNALQWIQAFQQDLTVGIIDFFSDPIGSIVDWVKDNAGAIFDWLGDNFSNFIDFLNDVGGNIAGFVEEKLGGAWDFITDKAGDFFDWLGEISGSIADYIGGAIGDFVDWSSEQLGGIWEGIQKWFTEAISGFVEAFFSGVDTGIEEAKHSPLHSDEPVRNPVMKGLLKVVREHRKKYGRDEITGEKK